MSILIPAYNSEAWIGDTIHSALSQTWPSKEVVVVDDGSTDGTLEVAKSFESEAVRVVAQPNRGAADARNTALAVSRGDYLQWLDADDLLAPDKISSQLESLRIGATRRTLLSSSFGKFMYRPEKAVFAPTELWCDLTPREFFLRKLEHNVYMQTATWLVSRELTEAAGPWDKRLVYDDDGEYFARVMLASDGIHFVDRARVYYRSVGTTSVSYVGQSSEKLDAMWLSMRLHMGYLRSLRDDERARSACVTYLQNYLGQFDPMRLDLAEEVRQAAVKLGGRLDPPRMSWKYDWIRLICGRGCAQRVGQAMRAVKGWFARSFDHALYRLSVWRSGRNVVDRLSPGGRQDSKAKPRRGRVGLENRLLRERVTTYDSEGDT